MEGRVGVQVSVVHFNFLGAKKDLGDSRPAVLCGQVESSVLVIVAWNKELALKERAETAAATNRG